MAGKSSFLLSCGAAAALLATPILTSGCATTSGAKMDKEEKVCHWKDGKRICKMKEGKCGEGKCGEGQCGEGKCGKKKMKKKAGKTEGSCGEGSCG